ncbi:MAG: rhodanese-like domain-containing protein [Verrucomicrobia bacterium]|nr:rhodanese-like domain-containing protein [Verrucomicrobiota bacterium]
MKKLVSLLLTLGLAAAAFAASGKVPDITQADLEAAITKKSATILDVNGTDSFKEGRIPGAIDYIANKDKLASLLPKDKKALVIAYCGNEYCTAYQAAASAALALGYTNVKHYSPGIDGWKKSGAKVEKS